MVALSDFRGPNYVNIKHGIAGEGAGKEEFVRGEEKHGRGNGGSMTLRGTK